MSEKTDARGGVALATLMSEEVFAAINSRFTAKYYDRVSP